MTDLIVTLAGKALETAIPEAMKAWLGVRGEQAKEILLKQIRKGRPWRVAGDKEAFMVLRYFRAAAEGSAIRNLELLAEAVSNGHDDIGLTTEVFKLQADNIADLTWEEIIILAAIIRYQEKLDAVHAQHFSWGEVVRELAGPGNHPFSTAKDLDDHMWPLTRTGYVAAHAAMDGMTFEPTQRLRTLTRLLDLEAAADRAKAQGRPAS